jgi:hypothetical protein
MKTNEEMMKVEFFPPEAAAWEDGRVSSDGKAFEGRADK